MNNTKTLFFCLCILMFVGCKKNAGPHEDTPGIEGDDFTKIPTPELVTTDLSGYISKEDRSLFSSTNDVYINPSECIPSMSDKNYLLQGDGWVYTDLITTDKNLTNVYYGQQRLYKSFPVTSSIKNYFRIELGDKINLGGGQILADEGGKILFDNGKGSLDYDPDELRVPGFCSNPGMVYDNMWSTINVASRDILSNDFALQLPAFLAGDDKGERWFLMPYATIDLLMHTTYYLNEPLDFRGIGGAELKLPITEALQNEAPDSVYGWRLGKKGLWEKDSVLRKNDNSYIGRVNKRGTWLFAKQMKGVYQTIALRTQNGATVPQTAIRVKYKNRVIAESITDADGNAAFFLPTNESLTAEVLPDRDTRSTNTYEYPLGIIKGPGIKLLQIPDKIPEFFILNGNVFDCEGKRIKSGVAKLNLVMGYGRPRDFFVPVKDGKFSVALWYGLGISGKIQISDVLTGKQTELLELVFSLRKISNNNYYTCEDPPHLYHNYYIDDKYYEVTDDPNSSTVFLKGVKPDHPANFPNVDFQINMTDARNQGISFNTWGMNIKNLRVNGIDVESDSDFSMGLYEVDGGKYIQGFYSIFYKDNSGKTHNIQGDLRLKRFYP